MTTTLNGIELAAITENLTSLNELWQANITAEVSMEWPESFRYTDPNYGETIGHAVWDVDQEQWVFRPAPDNPLALIKPPSF